MVLYFPAMIGHFNAEGIMNTDYLTALGVGAGFDTKAIVTSLVNADKAGRQSSIDQSSAKVDASISGMAQLKSAMKTLQSAFQRVDDKRDFNFSSLTNSAPQNLNATFDASTSVSGTYKVGVTQLAQNEVVQSVSYTSQTADQNSGVPANIIIQLGSGQPKTVSLDAGSVSLGSLVAGINALNADVTARLVETSIGVYRVLVEGPQGGSSHLTISDTVFGLSETQNILQAAQDASVSINELVIQRPTNEISDVIPGLKLNLTAVTNEDVVLLVGRDTSVAKAAITNLVKAYNAFDSVMDELTSGDGISNDAGSLKSDSGIKAIRQTVRDFLTSSSSTPGEIKNNFATIGISLQKDGLLKVNDAVLGESLSTSYDDIILMFSANSNDQSRFSSDPRGIAGDVVDQIDKYLSSSGIVTTRDAGYSIKKTHLLEEQTALDRRMEAVKERYTQQFSTMSKIIDEMKSTQDYLKTQLENLPFNSKNN